MKNSKKIRSSLTISLLLTAAMGNAYALQSSQLRPDVKFPPWQNGKNNPAVNKGLNFNVPQVNSLPDFHGNFQQAELVIFVGGNYFFAMADLVQAFQKKHPEMTGKIYYETLPPGILQKQIKHNGTITVGNMTWTVKPDVYAAGKGRVEAMIKSGELVGPQVDYVTNNLTIMVPKDNPAKITQLNDLAKPGVRVVMPNPATEGIAIQASKALVKAGGDALNQAVYKTKVDNGSTALTTIHHRQTPLALMQGYADGGVTWKSEAIFQQEIGNPISFVDIPDEHNITAIYSAAMVKDAKHQKAAALWLDFLKSADALKVFEHYGFKAYKKP